MGDPIDARRHVLDSAEIIHPIAAPFLDSPRRGITLKESRQSHGPQGERRAGNPGTGPLNGMSEVKGPAFPVRVPESSLGQLRNTLRYADFRVLWVSTLSNQIGQGMQQVVLGWLVFEMTGSAAMVGVVFALRSAPNLIVGFIAGSMSDRLDRRSIMRGSLLGMVVLAAGAAVAVYTGAFAVWLLMLAAFLMGVFHTFYMSSRMVYVYDLVGSGAAMQGIAIISLAQRLGGVFGALLAGGAIHWWGPGTTFTIMGCGYAIGGLALLWLREAGESAPLERESVRENIVNYFTQLRSNRTMLILIVTTGAGELFGFSHQVMLPVLAKEVLHVGPSGLGVLTAFRFFGGTLGVLGMAALGEVRRRGPTLLVVLFLFGVGQVLLSQASVMWTALVFVALINSMASAADILHQGMLQFSVTNQQRGRAMGSWLVATGVGPAGQVEIGFLAGATSPKIALLAHGIILASLAVVLGLLSPRLRKM